MEFFRGAKKSPDDAATGLPSAAAAPDRTGDVQEMLHRLASLGQMFAEANEAIAGHLLRRETMSQATPAASGDFVVLAGKIDALAAKLDRLVDRGATELAPVRQPEPAPAIQPQPVAVGAETPRSNDWQRAILGPELTENASLEFQRQQLCNGILDGQAAACSLAGQLLLFQSAAAEKMPPLLKDIGEAYYRWQPKTQAGETTMETALVRWLQERCQAVGLSNAIDPVNPGERFDSARHNASTRGVEISEVHGWVVLRDNGKVYTKAAVTVK